MRRKYVVAVIVLAIIAVFYMSKIYLPITGTVVDAESGQPIEGAVVLVEWTKTKGIGLTYTEQYKIIEVVTEKDGKFTISGIYSPIVNPPRLTVYKSGYVGWNNEYVFPTWEKRNDFSWVTGLRIKLVSYNKEFVRADHVFFLQSVTHWGKLMSKAYRWEELEKEIQR